MIQVAIATTTISPNRIVYADGSVKRDLVGSPGSAGLPPPVPVPVSTSSIATAVSVSLDMDLSFGGDHDRHSPHGLVGKAITHAGAVAAPRKQRDDTQHNHDCDHPAKCTTRAHGTTSERIALQGACHAVPAAASLAELEAGDLHDVHARLAHLRDRVRVALVGDDNARLEGDDVVAVVPLLALLLVLVAAGLDDMQLLDAQRVGDGVEEVVLHGDVKAALGCARPESDRADVADDCGVCR